MPDSIAVINKGCYKNESFKIYFQLFSPFTFLYMKYYILFFSFFLFEGLFAQDKVPKTSIYLLEVKSEDNTYTFGDSLIINAPGYYNNQPSFSYNSKVLYYTSILKDKKADI